LTFVPGALLAKQNMNQGLLRGALRIDLPQWGLRQREGQSAINPCTAESEV